MPLRPLAAVHPIGDEVSTELQKHKQVEHVEVLVQPGAAQNQQVHGNDAQIRAEEHGTHIHAAFSVKGNLARQRHQHAGKQHCHGHKHGRNLTDTVVRKFDKDQKKYQVGDVEYAVMNQKKRKT